MVTLAPSQIDVPEMFGTLYRYADFTSQFVDPRHVDVWLPPGYAEYPELRYPVLYMHDGQNLFDPRSSFAGVDWGIDEVMQHLTVEHNIRPAIVVALWNTPKRFREYMPARPLRARMRAKGQGELLSDAYLKFITSEIKPLIDATYRTQPDVAHTSTMGSSMGALISIYALCEYPQIFGRAGCVSIPWMVNGGILIEWLRSALPAPDSHRIYYDHGTAGQDAAYEPYQVRADAVMRAAGYQEGKDWVTGRFAGADHSERAWRERVHVPLHFLLGE